MIVLQDRASLSVNTPRTCSESDTPMTQDRSRFELEDTRRELIAMRVKHGADTPVGHRISNLIEQCKNLRSAMGERRTHLIAFIEKSMAEIKALTPDQLDHQ